MKSDNNYCVYEHRNKITQEVFYVGSGRVSRAYSLNDRNEEWLSIVNTCGFNVEILQTCLTKEESLKIEEIVYIQRKETCPLVNSFKPRKLAEYPVESIFENLYYDETSPTKLRWKITREKKANGRQQVAGNPTGRHSDVIHKVNIDGKSLLVHKVVLILHGVNIPSGFVVDHIDGNNVNNSISNLRVVDYATNSRNRKKPSNNKTGVVGVSIVPDADRLSRRYRATGYDMNGERFGKYFSIDKLGEDEAFRQACEYRQYKIAELNANGAGYTDRHISK